MTPTATAPRTGFATMLAQRLAVGMIVGGLGLTALWSHGGTLEPGSDPVYAMTISHAPTADAPAVLTVAKVKAHHTAGH